MADLIEQPASLPPEKAEDPGGMEELDAVTGMTSGSGGSGASGTSVTSAPDRHYTLDSKTQALGLLALRLIKEGCQSVAKSSVATVLVSTFVASLLLAFASNAISPDSVQDALWFVRWILLGVASSIGLGSGLHTFTLFLGPHIAKVTLTACALGHVNFNDHGPLAFVPYNSSHVIDTSTLSPLSHNQPHHLTLLQVYAKIYLVAYFWGFGTALGELPPYFISRGASLAKQKNSAVIKTSLQSFAIVFLFWGGNLARVFALLESPNLGLAHVPVLAGLVSSLKNMLLAFDPSSSSTAAADHDTASDAFHASSLVSMVWNLVLMGMVAFFVVSLLDSLAVQELNRLEQEASTDATVHDTFSSRRRASIIVPAGDAAVVVLKDGSVLELQEVEEVQFVPMNRGRKQSVTPLRRHSAFLTAAAVAAALGEDDETTSSSREQ
ncbi:hypothetical protein BC830DRAFT_1166019 [Chytriomyces sp. MP71]|nr:hypothetical protein BC830DRAFT_1166019 [Chytriomyces sp. MP71]